MRGRASYRSSTVLVYMDLDREDMNARLRAYEGLVGKTATMVAPKVELEIDDIRSILMLKVWRGLLAFDPVKSKPRAGETVDDAERRYVFMVVADQVKSIHRLKKHGLLSLDQMREGSMNGRAAEVSRFDHRYLSTDDDYDHVGEEPDLPDTLTHQETEVVVRLYRDYRQAEIAREMGLGKTEMERLMKSIRLKLEDWRPDPDEDIEALMVDNR